MKKLVFFDIDGTLVTRNNHIPKSTLQAITALKQTNAVPVLATGRAPVLIKEIAQELKIDSYIAMNGQYIVHQGQVLYANPIDKHLVDAVVEIATARQDGLLLSSDDELVANSVISLVNRSSLYTFLKGFVGLIPDQIQASLLNRLMKKVPKKEAYENKEIYMININGDQVDEAAYERLFGQYLTFTRANERTMDVINKGISKATGAQQMIEQLKVAPHNTYAFGDGLNDLELLEFVNTGVAMANGFAELKTVADFVTAAADDDGIFKGLKELGLI